MINGIDITNPTRSFQDSEWEALGYNGGRAYVLQACERMSGRGKWRKTGRGGQHNVSGGNSTYQTGSGAAIEDAAAAATTGQVSGDRGAQNGRGFGRNADGRGRH